MYLEPFDFDRSRPYVVHWGGQFRLNGLEPSYFVTLNLVPCGDLATALYTDWKATPEAVRDSHTVDLPVEMLSYVELSSIWHQGRCSGMAALAHRRFRLDLAFSPTLMQSNEVGPRGFTIPREFYTLGNFGFNTPLTRIRAAGGSAEVLFHPIALMQGLYGGSSEMWKLLASGMVNDPDVGAYSEADTRVEGRTLRLKMNKRLSRSDDWRRVSAFHAFPDARRIAAGLFQSSQHMRQSKSRGYIWADVPALPALTVDCRGIPLPPVGSIRPFLVLALDGVYFDSPYDYVILDGHGKRAIRKKWTRIHRKKGIRPGRPSRYLGDEMEILSGGFRSNRQLTTPQLHRIHVGIGALRIPDPDVPEEEIIVTAPPRNDNPQDPVLMVPIATTGPGISDDEGNPEAKVAGTMAEPLVAPAPVSGAHYQDLVEVTTSLAEVAKRLNTGITFITLAKSPKFKVGAGIVGELPTNEGFSLLTKFAWMRRDPDVVRRVLVAELVHEGCHYYVLDCEKKGEKIAIGVLTRKPDCGAIDDAELGIILMASVRTRGVWQALDGSHYRVTKLLHAPVASVADRIARAITRDSASQHTQKAPPNSGPTASASRDPGLDTPTSGSQRIQPPPMSEQPNESQQ